MGKVSALVTVSLHTLEDSMEYLRIVRLIDALETNTNVIVSYRYALYNLDHQGHYL